MGVVGRSPDASGRRAQVAADVARAEVHGVAAAARAMHALTGAAPVPAKQTIQ